MKQCNELFGYGDNCTWIVLLIGAYFFLSNGCLGNIFGECDNSIVWIIVLFFLLYLYNCNTACCY